MAEEKSDKKNSSSGPVDVDQLHLKLLFICKNKRSFEQVANYLVRRGWETIITTNLKDAFKTIAALKPNFICASVNLPMPEQKIMQLPTVLFQTFKAPVITLGEENDTKTMRLMQAVPANYKITGAISGPSVHRRIKQFIQEMQDGDKPIDLPSASPAEEQEATVVVKGSGRKKKVGYTFHTEEKKPKQAPGVFIAKGEKSADFNAAERLMMSNISDKAKGGAGASEEDFDYDLPDALSSLADSFEQEAAEIKPSAEQEPEPSGGIGVIMPPKPEKESKGPIVIVPDEATTPAGDPQSWPATAELQALIKRLARECAMALEEPNCPLTHVYECDIIPVTCNELRGFLKITHSGKKEHAQIFNKLFMEKFKSEGPRQFKKFELGPELVVHVGGVEFSQPVASELFTYKTANAQGEAGLKLLYTERASPKVSVQKNTDMAKIDVSELVTDVSTGVCMYLYLPKNEKHFLYLDADAKMSEKQKEKLVKTNSDLFINVADVTTYKDLFTRNLIIKAMRDIKKDKKSA